MEINEQNYNGLQQYLLQTLNPVTQKEGLLHATNCQRNHRR
jgi:hypothetical protein